MTALSFKFRLGALESPDPRLRHESLFRDLAQAFEFFGDKPQLFIGCSDLPAVALALAAGLGGPLAKHAALRRQDRRTRAHLGFLDLECPLRFGLVFLRQSRKFGWRNDRSPSLLLRLKPGALGKERDRLGRQGAFLRTNFGCGEANQDLAAFNASAFLDEDFANNSAVSVLDRLPLAGDDQFARRLGRRVEPRERRPAEEYHEEEDRHGLAEADLLRGIIGAVVE